MKVALIGIDYDEGVSNSFRAVTVKIGEDVTRFDKPVHESFIEALNFCCNKINNCEIFALAYLSSIDSFVEENCKEYAWKYSNDYDSEIIIRAEDL